MIIRKVMLKKMLKKLTQESEPESIPGHGLFPLTSSSNSVSEMVKAGASLEALVDVSLCFLPPSSLGFIRIVIFPFSSV